ncbi:MAG: CheY-like chemotaxis protein/HPt (histidine-containing phosphotransfer) domain-containing protein [Paracoccaceae bacterium]|jgi:CheY-like chemotaxis protein/HPt (histidine-containing phosphotransfer) domain-containing protein
MNGVLGMAGLMLDSDLTSEQRERLEMITLSGEALLGLLNDILDISKIEAGGFEFEQLHFDVAELLDEVAALMGSRAEQLGLIYSNKIEPGVPQVLIGDIKRIRQILINIVGNAVKFTRSGQIHVSVSRVKTDDTRALLRFEVTDTGIGIDAQAQDRIFEKFTQADSSTTRRFGGTGLGLAISKELAELMGGEIGVDSAIGEGSRFWFTVNLDIGDRHEIASKKSPSTLRDTVPLERQITVLVAEDNTVNQEIARQTLEDAGHVVTIAVNGLEAVSAVQKAHFDVILMDVHMPEMDGPTATRKIRELPAPVSEIPIIALTADAMAGDREKFIGVGMNDYLSKPFNTKRLFATIARHVGGTASLGRPENAPPVTQGKADSSDKIEEAASGLDDAIISPIRENKPDLWKRLVRLYLANTPEYLDAMENALSTRDRAALCMAAHSMKSSSANLGAMELSSLCEELEIGADTEDVGTERLLVSKIRQEFAIVSIALQNSTNQGQSND